MLKTKIVFLLSVSLLLALVATTGFAQQETAKKETAARPTEVGDVPWRSIGPANMGGRITALAVSAADSSTWWAATASGGLLKTTNNGVTFEHQFDGEQVAAVGDVAVSASNPDIVWVGTGESNPRNSVSWGNGVYKSTDGGKTWEHMGLKDSYQIGRVAIHPTNPDIVYVGALGRLWGENDMRGVYKTTDGGKTWNRIHHVDAGTGVIEMQMHPTNPDTLLIATYVRQRDGFDTNSPAVKFGEGAGVFKTTDGGATWKRITEGLPTCKLGRIGLDYYGKNPDVVFMVLESEVIGNEPENKGYAGLNGEDAEVGARLTRIVAKSPASKAGFKRRDIVVKVGDSTIHTFKDLTDAFSQYLAGDTAKIEVSRDKKSVALELTFGKRKKQKARPGQTSRPPYGGRLGGQVENVQDQQGAKGYEYGGIYRSDNGGDSWTRINSLNPRPMYFSQIRVDPSNDKNLFVLGISLYRSFDGGKTFKGDGHRGIHVDHHALWIDPSNGRHMILGNDGGIYVTWDQMAKWDHHNHMAIGQFYHVGVGPKRDYSVYGGLQDNGSWGGLARATSGSGPTNENWMRIGSGDGFVCRVDPNDPDQLFYESQNGSMGRRNLRTGERGSIRPPAIKRKKGEPRKRYRFNWNTPFILSNHNTRIFYTAGNHVFRSLDRGKKLKVISPEITETERGSGTAISESPRDEGVLYAGTDDGGLWMTKDGGTNWVNLRAAAVTPAPASPAAPAETETETETELKVALKQEVQPKTSQEDLITGIWKGEAFSSQRNATARPFTLQLHRQSATKYRGYLKMQMMEGDLSAFSYDEKTKILSFTVSSGNREMEGTLHVAAGRTTGSLSFGGRFTMEADLERKSPEHGLSDEKAEEAPVKEAASDAAQPMIALLPEPMWVSSLVASRFKTSRVYVTIDGHRSDVDGPLVFASENHGETWRPLHGSLPEGTGSARVIVEDLKNADLLFLGTEFGAFVSINRGQTWSKLSGLPTVAVHDFAIHPKAHEIVAATHGRSLWVADIASLRQMTEARLESPAYLFKPNTVVMWRSQPSRGTTTRKFTGANPPSGVRVWYSLGEKAKEISLVVENKDGEVVATLKPTAEKGLHDIHWNLRSGSSGGGAGGRAGGRGGRPGRGGRSRGAALGSYMFVLTVDGVEKRQSFEIVGDPGQPDDRWLEFENFEDESNEEEEGAINASDIDI